MLKVINAWVCGKFGRFEMLRQTQRNAQVSYASQAMGLNVCLAKTRTLTKGNVIAGIDIFNHCLIVGVVARELMERMPSFLVGALFPKGSELIAAAHDLGKVSPTFQEKINRALDVPKSIPELAHVNPELEKTWGGHAGTSQATLNGQYKIISQIVGRHHGYTPSLPPLASDEKIGGEVWQNRRLELLNKLEKALNVTFPSISDTRQIDAISGLTSVADWIGSGHLFDQIEFGATSNLNLITSVKNAVDAAGFVRPKLRKGLSFNEVFGFEARPTQTRLIEVSHQPGVYILEAPMGVGKTEAALFAAYKMIEKELATGLYFALPTQLTSNKIHDRVDHFLTKILDDSCPHKALLLHSSAWLYKTEMGEDAQPGFSWFDSAKRGLLAPFAVGTIDQALMAVMNVKHGFVRSFGLAGKVVILDEVHSYDSYTGTIMDELIKGLLDLHCTVIILSATLTEERRNILLGSSKIKSLSVAYPLITALPKGNVLAEFEVQKIPDMEYTVVMKQTQDDAIAEALLRAELGQQVLWIENTVAEAQAIYKLFRAKEMSIEVGLLHSRFLKTHREMNESYWVKIFGKEGHATRNQCGRILVGTQVLEQSLDIDADFLVTRICPTDMLLQRLGRLWRHRETDSLRSKSAKCEAWIIAPTLEDALEHSKSSFGNTALVYSPYVLCRTIEVWTENKVIQLPSQMRSLIESTYRVRVENETMAKYFAVVEANRKKLSGLARISLSSIGKTLPESKASTRYSDQESCEVLLLKSYTLHQDTVQICLLDGSKHTLVKNAKAKDINTWRNMALLLAQNTVTVPVHFAPMNIERRKIAVLGEYIYIGKSDEEDSSFRIGLVNEALCVTSLDQGLASNKYKFEYRSDFGFLYLKNATDETAEDIW